MKDPINTLPKDEIEELLELLEIETEELFEGSNGHVPNHEITESELNA